MLWSGDDPEEKVLDAFENIVLTAAWLHHKITYIHPFREGMVGLLDWPRI